MGVEWKAFHQSLAKVGLWVKWNWIMTKKFDFDCFKLTSRGFCRYNIQGVATCFQWGLQINSALKYQITSCIAINEQMRTRNLGFQLMLFLILTSLNQLLSKARKCVWEEKKSKAKYLYRHHKRCCLNTSKPLMDFILTASLWSRVVIINFKNRNLKYRKTKGQY